MRWLLPALRRLTVVVAIGYRPPVALAPGVVVSVVSAAYGRHCFGVPDAGATWDRRGRGRGEVVVVVGGGVVQGTVGVTLGK